MAPNAKRTHGPLPLRRLVVPWLVGLVTFVVTGLAASVTATGVGAAGDVGTVVTLWLPLLMAPALSGAAAVLVLRIPDARVGEWLQSALPVPGVAAVFVATMGIAVHGPSLNGLAFTGTALFLVAAAATGAVLAGRLKALLGDVTARAVRVSGPSVDGRLGRRRARSVQGASRVGE